MKKLIVMMAAVACVGAVSADMFSNVAVGYGIFDPSGTVGIVPDQVGQEIIIQVVSGTSGVTAGGSLSYLLDPSQFGTVLNTGGPQSFTVATPGNFEDYASGASIVLDWQAYDVNATVIAIAAGLDGITAGDLAYVGSIASFITDRPFSGIAAPETIAFDSPDGVPSNAVGVNANAMVIPEPATFGLMGIAGLGMFLARRKARR